MFSKLVLLGAAFAAALSPRAPSVSPVGAALSGPLEGAITCPAPVGGTSSGAVSAAPSLSLAVASPPPPAPSPLPVPRGGPRPPPWPDVPVGPSGPPSSAAPASSVGVAVALPVALPVAAGLLGDVLAPQGALCALGVAFVVGLLVAMLAGLAVAPGSARLCGPGAVFVRPVLAGVRAVVPAFAGALRRASSVAGVAALVFGLFGGPVSSPAVGALVVLASVPAAFAAPVVSPLAPVVIAPVLAPRAGSGWDRALFETQTPVGGSDGSAFSLVGRAGAVVTKVQFFRHNNGTEKYLRGLRVSFSDDSEMVAGSEESRYQEFDLPAGSVVSRLSLSAWNNAKNKRTRVGRIHIESNKGGALSFGVDDGQSSTEVPMRVGSGVLVGFEGRAGKDLDQLAPVFLKKLDRAEIVDVEVEPFDPTYGLRLVTLDSDHAVWKGTPYTYHFSGSASSSTSTSWSNSFSENLGVTTKLVANWVPSIMSTELSAEWGFGASQSHGMSESSSRSLSWAIDREMKSADDEAVCEARVWEGRLDLRWEGTFTLTTKDGLSASFPTSGTVQRVAVGKVTHECRPLKWMSPELKSQLLAKVALYHPNE